MVNYSRGGQPKASFTPVPHNLALFHIQFHMSCPQQGERVERTEELQAGCTLISQEKSTGSQVIKPFTESGCLLEVFHMRHIFTVHKVLVVFKISKYKKYYLPLPPSLSLFLDR